MNSLKLELSQKLNMTQQLVQAVTILAMSGQDINDMVDKEVLENPVLELADNTQANQLDERWTQNYPQSQNASEAFSSLTEQKSSIQDHLLSQIALSVKTKEEKAIAEYIIGSLNESGYLEQPLDLIAKKFATSQAAVNQVRQAIQELDPPGFASLNVSEFLLLQLDKKVPNTIVELAKVIIEEHLLALAQRDFESIAMATDQVQEIVVKAAELIRNLTPRPINAWSGQGETHYITPDIMIEKIENKYIISLNPLYTRRLRIHDEYADLRKKVDKTTKQYISKNLRSAQWIIQCLEQREKTMRKISEILVSLQKDFLDFGLLYMHPLTLKQVAQMADVHESTVSRAISNKYAQTPHGTISMKAFFPAGITSINGQKINSTQIKKRIAEIIKLHGKISDQKIASILADEGITIARRTIAKYRSTVGIHSSFNRKT